ncbi:MAG: STAS domain-containing protein [Treponema sp.]|jgi:anti-anti-sigma factor|nr:STAS domain-containing protein [Treponema sp.]
MEKDEFTITEKKGIGSVTFIITGRVNTSNAGTLEYKLEKALNEKQTTIILNMSQVVYLSSTGIRVLLKIYKQAKIAGGKFNIESPSENVKNVLGLTALDELLLK